jgi:hypothetical protein
MGGSLSDSKQLDAGCVHLSDIFRLIFETLNSAFIFTTFCEKSNSRCNGSMGFYPLKTAWERPILTLAAETNPAITCVREIRVRASRSWQKTA